MSQRDLNRAIARATGEDISTITGMGFVELTPFPIEREPLMVDWDGTTSTTTSRSSRSVVAVVRRRDVPSALT